MTEIKPEYRKAETFETTCYLYRNEILYVPHYSGQDAYVGPGYGTTHKNSYTADFLLSVGAVEVTRPLWKRGTCAVVDK